MAANPMFRQRRIPRLLEEFQELPQGFGGNAWNFTRSHGLTPNRVEHPGRHVRSSPARMFRIDATVIEPPATPHLTDNG